LLTLRAKRSGPIENTNDDFGTLVLMESLVGRIAKLHELYVQALEPQLRSAHLTWSNFQLLSLVASFDEAPSQADVSRALGIEQASVSEAVSGLVAMGLLVRRGKSGDRRAKVLHLTDDARQRLMVILNVVRDLDALAISRIGEQTIAECARILDVAIKTFESSLEDSIPGRR